MVATDRQAEGDVTRRRGLSHYVANLGEFKVTRDVVYTSVGDLAVAIDVIAEGEDIEVDIGALGLRVDGDRIGRRAAEGGNAGDGAAGDRARARGSEVRRAQRGGAMRAEDRRAVVEVTGERLVVRTDIINVTGDRQVLIANTAEGAVQEDIASNSTRCDVAYIAAIAGVTSGCRGIRGVGTHSGDRDIVRVRKDVRCRG